MLRKHHNHKMGYYNDHRRSAFAIDDDGQMTRSSEGGKTKINARAGAVIKTQRKFADTLWKRTLYGRGSPS